MRLAVHARYWVIIAAIFWAAVSPDTYSFGAIGLSLVLIYVLEWRFRKANDKIDKLIEDADKTDQLPPSFQIRQNGELKIDDRVALICPECSQMMPVTIIVTVSTEGPEMIYTDVDVTNVWAHMWTHDSEVGR